MPEVVHLHAEASADVAPAIGQLKLFDEAADEAAEDRTARIRMEMDHQPVSQFRLAMRDVTEQFNALPRATGRGGAGVDKFNISMRTFGNIWRILKFPVYITGFQLLGSAAVGAGVGIVGLSSSLRPLVGLLAGLPGIIGGAVGAIGTMFLGLSRVTGALKAHGQAQDAATRATNTGASAARSAVTARRQQEAAARAVADAEKDLAKAHEDVAEAQRELNELIGEQTAKRLDALADHERDVERASISLARAQDRLGDAQRALQEALNPTPATALELRDAELDLAEAQEALRKASQAGAIDIGAMQRAERELGIELDDVSELFRVNTTSALERARAEQRVAEATEKLNKLQRKGEVDAEKVSDAQLDVRDATLDVVEAEARQIDLAKDLIEINKMGTEQDEKIISARNRLADVTDRVSDRQESLADAHRRVREEAEDAAAGTDKVSAAGAKLNTAMQEMTQAGRDFANFVITELKPRLETLRDTAETALLPALQTAITAALPLFAPLNTAVGEFGRAVGSAAIDMGTFLGSDFFTGKFSTISTGLSGVIRESLGPALVNVASGFTSLMNAAMPLVEWMGRLTERLTGQFAQWAKTGDETGRLKDFFEKTAVVTEQLIRIFGHLWTGLGNVMKAAEPLGTWLLDSIEKVTARFREWTGQADNMARMTEFFNSWKPALSEAAGLVGDLAKGLVQMSDPGGLANVFSGLRDLVPSLVELGKAAQGAFAPALIDAVGKFVPLLTKLMENQGALTLFVTALGNFAGVINTLVEVIPGGEKMLGLLLTGLAGFKTFKLGGKLMTFLSGGLLSPAKFSTFGKTLLEVSKHGGTLRQSFQSGLMTAFPKLLPILNMLKTGFMALWGVMMANPFIAIAIGAAIAVALIIKHWDTIKEFFGKLWGWLQDLWDKVTEIFVTAWQKIYDFLLGGSIIPDIVNGIIEWITFIPRKILELLGKAADILFDIGKKIFEGLINGLKWIWEHSLYGFLWGRKDAILGFFGDAINWLLDIGKNILRGLWSGITWIWDNVIKPAFNVAKWVKDTVGDALGWLLETGKDVLRGIWNGIKWIWDHEIKGLLRIKDWIMGALETFGKPVEWLLGVGKDIMMGLKDGILNGLGAVKDAVGGIGSKLISWKGPPSYDRKILLDNGRLIMQGLERGLREGESGIHAVMRDVSGQLTAIGGDFRPTVNPMLGAMAGGAARPIHLEITVNGAGSPEETAMAVRDAGGELVQQLMRELRSR